MRLLIVEKSIDLIKCSLSELLKLLVAKNKLSIVLVFKLKSWLKNFGFHQCSNLFYYSTKFWNCEREREKKESLLLIE